MATVVNKHIGKVSIIVPMYNVEAYIACCLDSIAKQTYNNIEAILIDDCCTDNTVGVCRSYIKDYEGPVDFLLLHNQTNKGLSYSRNVGLDNATGEFVYFLDSDDFITNDAISSLYCSLVENPTCSIAISYFTAFSDEGVFVYRDDWVFSNNRIITPDEFGKKMLTEESNFAATAKLYRYSLIHNVRFQVGKKNEDTLFIVDLIPFIESNQVFCIEIPDYSYYYRIRKGSITQTNNDPLEWYVLQNYDYAISHIRDRIVIDWLRDKQLRISLRLGNQVARHSIAPFSQSDVHRYLRRYSLKYCKSHLSKADFRVLVVQRFFPHLYSTYVRLRSVNNL